jgi:hypothetical protein
MILAMVVFQACATAQEPAQVLEGSVSSLLEYALSTDSDPMDHALIDGANVHVFLPPVPVSKGRVVSVDWSDDGKYLLVASERSATDPAMYKAAWEGKGVTPRDVAFEIHLYDAKRGTSTLLHKQRSELGSSAQIEFFGKGNVAIASVTSGAARSSKILRLSASSSRVEHIESVDSPEVSVDPTGEYVAVAAANRTVRFIPATGPALTRQPLPEGKIVTFGYDGTAYAQAKSGVIRIVPGGKYSAMEEPDDWPFLTRVPMTGVFAYPVEANVQDRRFGLPTVEATLHSGGRSIKIAFDAHSPNATDKSTGVFYASGGYNYVRPIIQVTKSAFDKMIKGARREGTA